MSNTQLLSQSHSGIVRSLQSSGANNPYVYSVDASTPNVSQTVTELRPSSEATGDQRQTLEFPLARQGFLNGMVLQVVLSNAADGDADNIAKHYAANMVSSAELTVRGRPIRKANTLSLAELNLQNQGTFKERYHLSDTDGNAVSDPRTLFLDLGRAFGIDSAPMNNLDTLFCEDMTVNVVLEAVSSFSSGDVDRNYESARLFCRYGMLESAEYDKYRSENFSSSQPTRRLVKSHEKEVKKRLTGLDANVVNTATIDLKMKNLVTRTVFAVETVYNGAAHRKGRFNPVKNISCYANGQEIWSTSSPEAIYLMDDEWSSNKSIKEVSSGVGGTVADNNTNIYAIEWAQMGIKDPAHDKFVGAVNFADLTSAYLEITFLNNANDKADVHVSHECRLLESVDGNSGLVSVSARE